MGGVALKSARGRADGALDGWSILSATGLPIYVLSPVWRGAEVADFELVYVSEEGARCVGQPASALVGALLGSLAALDLIGDALALCKHVLTTGEGATRTVSVAEGSVDARVFEQRVRASDRHVVIALHDVTAWTRGRDEDRAASERLQAILCAVPDALVLMDALGGIVQGNEAAARAFGGTVEGLVGTNIGALLRGGPTAEPEAWLRAQVLRAAEGSDEAPLTVSAVRRDGTRFPARLVVGEVSHGGEHLFVGLIHDLTREAELESQLRSNERLESLGRLAGGIAHDFNNLLTVIHGQVELLRLRLHDPEVLGMVDALGDASERAALLTRQLLTVGKQDNAPVGADELNRVIRDSATILAEMLGSAATLKIDLSDSPLPVGLSRTRIEQVLSNLVTNARDARPKRAVTLRTRLVEVGGAGYAELCVSDDGCGMSASSLRRALDPFYTTKGVGEGTGLGLTTVHAIADQAHGRVQIESMPDEGTTVAVRVPLLTSLVEVTRASPRRASRPGAARVLLVEDEPAVREATELLLEASGYGVSSFSNPLEALEALDVVAFDVVLTDVMMPHMNGRELAKKIEARMPDVPIVFMSGHTDDQVLRSGIVQNDVTFVQKPFSLAKLQSALSSALSS